MNFYERELDRQDDAVVRESILNLIPPVTREELAALYAIGEKPVWEGRFDSPLVGLWEFEQLDRRGWIEAQMVDLESRFGQPAVYSTRGGWYCPLHNYLGDGRPDWPTIWESSRRASEKPTSYLSRVWVRFRLSNRGWRVGEIIRPDDAPELGIYDAVAYGLQRLSAGWRQGDEEMLGWLRAGMSSASSGFEKMIGQDARNPVRRWVSHLRRELIPKLQGEVDPGVRDEVRAVVRAVDPDSIVHDEEDGETHRWRLMWSDLNCQQAIDELVPMLWGMQPRTPATCVDSACGDPGGEGTSKEDLQSPWTMKLLCKAISRSDTTVREWRKAAYPPIPGRTRGRGFSDDELRSLAAVARQGGDPEAANAIQALIGTLPR